MKKSRRVLLVESILLILVLILSIYWSIDPISNPEPIIVILLTLPLLIDVTRRLRGEGLFYAKSESLDIETFIERLGIRDISLDYKYYEHPVSFDRMSSNVVANDNELPKSIQELGETELQRLKLEAKEEGRTFDNNGSYSLHRVDIQRTEDQYGERQPRIKLIVKESDYYKFVFPNTLLDKLYLNESSQQLEPLRKQLGLEHDMLTIDNLPTLTPYHFKIGTGTLLISKDGFLIVSVRSQKQFIAAHSKTQFDIHLSTAEGMLRSKKNKFNSDLIAGDPNPFATSYRSLIDELNVPSSAIKLGDLKCLGIFMDKSRAQPFFLFYLKSQLSSDEIIKSFSDGAKDQHENDAIFGMKWNLKNALKLFQSPRPTDLEIVASKKSMDFLSAKNYKMVVASNQAAVGFAVGIWNDFNSTEIHKTLAGTSL